jgi:1-acyl-sn-glycerol-3-phosphate acyltransferase
LRHNRLLFHLFQIYKYLIVLPLFGLSTVVLVPIGLIVLIISNDKIASRVAVAWARFNSTITPMLVRVVGNDKINRQQSYVIVANHQSLYDILVLYGWMPVDFKWVMKAELRNSPFIGYFCHKIGHIFVDRSNPEAAQASINSAKNKITNGTSIIFFPEGTWSKNGRLLNFKMGAFKLAAELRLPVLPVTIINTNNILPGDTLDLFPGRAKLVIHDPIRIEDFDNHNLNELATRAKNSIQNGLDEYSKTH